MIAPSGGYTSQPVALAAEHQIAAFFDAENISAVVVDTVRMDLLQRGRLLIRKAYGDFQSNSLKPWVSVCKSYGIEMLSRPELAAGKNASDIAMVIDAMECLVTRTNIDLFALISSDSDFTPLASRLREHGKFVVGFGGQQCPVPFRQACDEFVILGREDSTFKPIIRPFSTIEQMSKANAHEAVRRALRDLELRHAEDQDSDGGCPWILVDELLNLSTRMHKDFRSLLRSWKLRWVEFLSMDEQLELNSHKSASGCKFFVRHRTAKDSDEAQAAVAADAPVEEDASVRKKRRRPQDDIAKTDEPEPKRAKYVQYGRLSEYRAAVRAFLCDRGERWIHLQDITRKIKMDKTLLHQIAEKGYERAGDVILNMKGLEVKGTRVRLQQSLAQ